MKIIKRILLILGIIAVVGFLAFLYLIPPFTLVPPEEFINPTLAAGPSLDAIADPATRLLAERGKYIVTIQGCTDCHTPQGDAGPDFDRYLAGGNMLGSKEGGTIITRNLTPDEETGLRIKSDEQVKRLLRGGVFPDGRIANHRAMPWPNLSRWTEEDRHAVITYLRNLKPVRHKIPDPVPTLAVDAPDSVAVFVAGDYGIK